MQAEITSSEKKSYYILLDGLRGVAAIMVLWYHIFEAHTTDMLTQKVNHGYLMVDFFFILSGFVIGHAYNSRWENLTNKEFLKRRLIRLHPMVIFGALFGAVLFYYQGCEAWDVSKVSFWALCGATLLNLFLIPATPNTEIRGIGEMYPLNGPSWSLFFEYVGNLLYALFIRKFSVKALKILIVLFGIGLASFAIFGKDGFIGAGWSLTTEGAIIGSLRFLFSFTFGLLLSKIFKPFFVKNSFWIASILLIIIALYPRLGGEDHFWLNGLYDILCVSLIFPIIVYFTASENPKSKITKNICKFLGNLSYPLYMVHYPIIYYYYAWVKNNGLTNDFPVLQGLMVFFGSILLAYIVQKLYDEPIRKYLTNRFLKNK
ncbi:MAG: acyltransferase [Capnocytophaga sp.]|nr:acyltransferase [Capnocytophaga sp.]